MTEFEKVLQQCLSDLEQGASNVEDCLRRYPKYAPELEPILMTGAYLEQAREARISDPFRARVRTKLIQQMRAHPRKPARAGWMFIPATAVRLATGFVAILLALLITGTAYAQCALPGNKFYSWKLISENVWRGVSPDPVGTDLAIAERRVDEMIAVSDAPALYAQTLNAYLKVSARLKSEISAENEERVLAAVNSQIEELAQSGIILLQPAEGLPPPFHEPTVTPTMTSPPVLRTPQVEPTGLPQIVPTVQVPSESTIEVPPGVLPTVEDLPQNISTREILPAIP
jgi:hypothetical protein